MSKGFRLGFLTHLEGAGNARRLYRETIELFVAAEAMGFEVGWVTQHHFKADTGRLPSPLPFLASVAERTRTLRLGVAVVVLPFEHPIRLAEDAAVVDLLSDGRLELGLGSGFDPQEFSAFGQDAEQRREQTSERLVRLQHALRGGELNDAGSTLQPQVPGLAERLWLSVYGVEGARHAARHGVGLLINRSVYDSDEPSDRLQSVWARAYREAAPPTARIGLSRGIYPAANRNMALEGLREGVGRFAAQLIAAGRVPAGQPIERYLQRLHVLYGHPDEIAAQLAADQVLPYTSDLIVQFSPATPTYAQALQMLEQVATQIAPALGWRPAHTMRDKTPTAGTPANASHNFDSSIVKAQQ